MAEYFRWNSDGFVQAVSVLGSAAILLAFAMLDRLADTGLGYGGHKTHLVLLASAVALAAPVGFRERHVMLAIRPIAGAVGLTCVLAPAIGWRIVPPAPGVTAHLPVVVIVLATAAFFSTSCVLASTSSQRWRAFLTYCRAPSVWSTRHGRPG